MLTHDVTGAHARLLAGLERKGRARRLIAAHGVDFASNDYLALAQAPRIAQAISAALARGVPMGAGGSRLLRGHHPEHAALETEAARHFGAQKALYFANGFAANLALFSTLPRREDLIVYDELIHASAIDGISASKAKVVSARHNDAQAVDDAIGAWREQGGLGNAWIAVETLYSMDGDRAPVDDLMQVANRHEAILVVDEAHATGVFGPQGRGLASAYEGRDNLISLHTCGKALGVSGGLICAAATFIDYLINRARPFVYSTAPSPLMAVGVREALRMVADTPTLAQDLKERVAFARARLGDVNIETMGNAHIIPILIRDNARAVRVSAALADEGFDIRAIRPPTVPEGTARLRISITLNASEDDMTRMSAALAHALVKSM